MPRELSQMMSFQSCKKTLMIFDFEATEGCSRNKSHILDQMETPFLCRTIFSHITIAFVQEFYSMKILIRSGKYS